MDTATPSALLLGRYMAYQQLTDAARRGCATAQLCVSRYQKKGCKTSAIVVRQLEGTVKQDEGNDPRRLETACQSGERGRADG
jgi:hypothetical protein